MGAEQSKKARDAGITVKGGQPAQQTPPGSAHNTPPLEEGKVIPGTSSAAATPPAVQPKPLAKVRLEDFELCAVVGRGQWGKVMMVRKRDSGAIYAMKVIRKEYMLGILCFLLETFLITVSIAKNQVANIKSERQLLELIKCPFIVHLHFAFQTDDKLYLILDYVRRPGFASVQYLTSAD